MHITVAGKQVETGEALKTHVREGLAVIARKYFDHALEANVTFRRDVKGKLGAFFACDINLKAGRGLLMRGEGEGHDAHRAFDVAAEHVAKRLRRYRRRVNDHARSQVDERAEAETAMQYVLQQPPEEPDQAEAAEDAKAEAEAEEEALTNADHGAVVAEQPTEIARLTVGEAAMRLDLAQVPLLLFRNSASGGINLVYRRPDGCVGWIEPPTA